MLNKIINFLYYALVIIGSIHMFQGNLDTTQVMYLGAILIDLRNK